MQPIPGNKDRTANEQPPLLDHLFIGAGAMKAGTTWLYQVIEKHPDIYFCPEKEIHYFYAAHVDPAVLSDRNRLRNVRDKYIAIDPDRSRPAGARYRLRWAANYLDGPVDDLWYRNLFAFRNAQRYPADFSNLYALLPADGWRRVRERVGRLRVLYTLRHPVKRLWSHVKFHLQITGQSDCLDRWQPDDFDRFLRQGFIWDNAEYGRALRSMRAALGDSELMVAFYEDIHRDRAAFLARLETFLGIMHQHYAPAMLEQRVNVTAKRPMPDFFADLVANDVERICDELHDEGLVLPPEWLTRSPSMAREHASDPT